MAAAAAAADPQNFCAHGFADLWRRFATRLTDTLGAGGPPAGPRPPPGPLPQLPSRLPAAERLVAVGDLHGDLDKARRAFRLAGLVDDRDRWTGGRTVVVQVGDVLDRGDDEIEILYYLQRLQREATAAGGAVHLLSGNHETMSVAGQFRYATPGAYHSFQRWLHAHLVEGVLLHQCGCSDARELRRHLRHWAHHHDGKAARKAALEPGGPLTLRFLARQPVVLQVGSSVFVHGGLLPEHVDHGLDRLNADTQEWMAKGPRKAQPAFLRGRDALVWSRAYSAEDPGRVDCEGLRAALAKIPGAKRMIVGHTIQDQGINSACQGRVLRIDVGMSSGCGDGEPEVLEILNDRVVRRLTEDKENKEQQQAQRKAAAAS